MFSDSLQRFNFTIRQIQQNFCDKISDKYFLSFFFIVIEFCVMSVVMLSIVLNET